MSNKVTLSDKYQFDTGRVFLSGTQALVRLPLVQARRDRAAGLNTGGFISGYRGSPLGTYDQELQRAQKLLDAHDIVFQPGVNEDLAMTAVWGSQQVGLKPGATKDGVFGLWYGKGPGLDRSMDALKHANAAGASPHGGVLAIVGDDHGAKSSTLPHQSDHNFTAAFVPFLYPSSVHEYVEYGLLGIAMSRFSGCWVGFKATADTVETSGVVDLASEHRRILIPDFTFPPGGVHIRLGDVWREEDWRLQRYKGFAALAFAKANRIDQLIWDSPRPRIGIISTGKSFADVLEALDELGIDAEVAADIGLRLYKVGMPWPLEPSGVRAFCEGLEEVLVVEEKREFIEHQLKWQLYNWREGVRPRVVGKEDESGNWLLPADNELTLGRIAEVIAQRLSRLHSSQRIADKLQQFADRESARKIYQPPKVRTPYFCSGCPHNTSTKAPEGARVLAGIGCHIMALWMDRGADTFTQMGGEGCTWVGEAPFAGEKHLFVNLGDGTYFHSGLLAIRQAVAAAAKGRLNCTYKILYNDAVAMTGGQHVDGELSVEQIARQLAAEGLARIVVVSEDPTRLNRGLLPSGVKVLGREHMPAVQEELRTVPGVTAIIYDQTCAAEKRRRRKRGQYPNPDKRLYINPAVCEGCGDCSVQSNCVSIEPLETALGRKRQINQSSCNKDYSCVKGFCPSFVELEGVQLAKPGKDSLPDFSIGLPLPTLPALTSDYNIFVTGVGGTGVLTISALLGMAGHIEGLASATADMAGLAQKGGAVYAHVRLAASNDALRSPRIITGGADLVLACDAVTAVTAAAQDLMDPTRTAALVNADIAPTADFVRNRDADFHNAAVIRTIRDHCDPARTTFISVERAAVTLLGDSIAANMILLGHAWQQGLLPLNLNSLLEAIKLNGVAVAFNVQAFTLGRALAADPARIEALIAARQPAPEAIPETLDALIAHRMAHLTAYQDATYAARYQAQITAIRTAEQAAVPGSERLTRAVAHNLAKLMSYKDEYEVARLYAHPSFRKGLSTTFKSAEKMGVWLAPPLLSKIDPATGRPQKRLFGPWIFSAFAVLARLKGLRGSRWDIFGRTTERRMERQLRDDYEALLTKIIADLRPNTLALAVELANLPDQIRGFGPVKEAALHKARDQEKILLARWQAVNAPHPHTTAA